MKLSVAERQLARSSISTTERARFDANLGHVDRGQALSPTESKWMEATLARARSTFDDATPAAPPTPAGAAAQPARDATLGWSAVGLEDLAKAITQTPIARMPADAPLARAIADNVDGLARARVDLPGVGAVTFFSYDGRLAMADRIGVAELPAEVAQLALAQRFSWQSSTLEERLSFSRPVPLQKGDPFRRAIDTRARGVRTTVVELEGSSRVTLVAHGSRVAVETRHSVSELSADLAREVLAHGYVWNEPSMSDRLGLAPLTALRATDPFVVALRARAPDVARATIDLEFGSARVVRMGSRVAVQGQDGVSEVPAEVAAEVLENAKWVAFSFGDRLAYASPVTLKPTDPFAQALAAGDDVSTAQVDADGMPVRLFRVGERVAVRVAGGFAELTGALGAEALASGLDWVAR